MPNITTTAQKTILITGVSQGIGFATANLFDQHEFHVIGTARDPINTALSPNIQIIQLDLLRPQSITYCLNELQDQRIDILINNAAILLESEDDGHINMALLKQSFDVNLFGLIDFCERILPLMRTNGHIINISSAWGALNQPTTAYAPHYKMTKSALNMYTKTLAERLNTAGITVSAFNPGWVKTNMGGHEAIKTTGDAARDIYSFSLVETRPSGRFWQVDKDTSSIAIEREW